MVAAPELIAEIAKVLDTLQICPARPAQGVVAWAIAAMRDWREEQRAELARRAQVTREVLAPANGWRIDSIGAYFAFVAHPFTGYPAAFAAETLARECGVLGLPGTFFGPGLEGHLRIAFANVGREALLQLPERLRALGG
jgi:aspartate/methionine/tyrosine aminotransferase